ncbi:diaminopimelate epimerase [Candidatus Dependentiae bacterium]|nr:diaminopimelate epimerase [Candidatus Dependentiae bacterium]
MLDNFFKYQSIGNDFIIFDCFHKDIETLNSTILNKSWKPFVIKICKRHFGIGADGVLIIKKDKEGKLPELLVYNSDGSKAEICINGLRCAALHLRDYHDLDKKLKIKIGQKITTCQINKNNVNIKISNIQYKKSKEIKVHEKNFLGHIVKVPNQHFVIPQKITSDWLSKNGKLIESHKAFKGKTNVEFVWPKDQKNKFYNVLVYERGVGPTLACGSGAAAIVWSLFRTHKIKINQKINLMFPGGKIVCWIDKNKKVSLQAPCKLVFKGHI